ncbi:hypothetical protein CR513_57694, partial [Mucuna pruriens]
MISPSTLASVPLDVVAVSLSSTLIQGKWTITPVLHNATIVVCYSLPNWLYFKFFITIVVLTF